MALPVLQAPWFLYALVILLVAVGHAVRDGMWAVHSTQLCRFLAAFWCFAGALVVLNPWHALAYAAAIWIGFYFDMKHGDGMGAASWADLGYLTLSGITSVMPLAVAAYFLGHACWVVLIGFAKPPIWFFCQWTKPASFSRWLLTHRAAATTFGAVIGTALVVLS